MKPVGYVYLLIACLFDSLKSCLSKGVSRYSRGLPAALFLNLCRCVLCALTGVAACLLLEGGFPLFTGASLGIASFAGVMVGAFMVTWLLGLRTGAFMMMTVISAASCMVPTLLSALFLGEPLRLTHLAGIALLIGASWLMCSYSGEVTGSLTPKALLFAGLAFATNGLSTFAQKLYVTKIPDPVPLAYNTWSFLAAVPALGLAFLLLCPRREQKKEGLAALGKTAPSIGVMAVSMYLVYALNTLASSALPAGLLYPMASGLVLLLNQCYSAFVLREKPNGKCLAGIGLAIGAMVVLNLG